MQPGRKLACAAFEKLDGVKFHIYTLHARAYVTLPCISLLALAGQFWPLLPSITRARVRVPDGYGGPPHGRWPPGTWRARHHHGHRQLLTNSAVTGTVTLSQSLSGSVSTAAAATDVNRRRGTKLESGRGGITPHMLKCATMAAAPTALPSTKAAVPAQDLLGLWGSAPERRPSRRPTISASPSPAHKQASAITPGNEVRQHANATAECTMPYCSGPSSSSAGRPSLDTLATRLRSRIRPSPTAANCSVIPAGTMAATYGESGCSGNTGHAII
mmetsp:Transcript_18574/g.48537  ORF Transcript_18574/g.48537 Transcript_18574/m.48537 type:complete len:273 (-) Transcript_18574:329-1147(-)